MLTSRIAPCRFNARRILSPRSDWPPPRQLQRRGKALTKQAAKQPERPRDIPNEFDAVDPAKPIDIPSLVWYHRLGPVSDFFTWFSRMQQKRPYSVQLGTSLTTYLCGDLLAQEMGGERYDATRTARMLFIGSIISIPGYKWFLFLGNNFNYRSKPLSIAIKVAIQQVFFAPIFNTYFFGMQAILTGVPPSGVIDRVMLAVPESVKNSAKFWPAVTAFIFAFVQPQYRFMFSGVFAIMWQSYLSYLNRSAEQGELPEMIV